VDAAIIRQSELVGRAIMAYETAEDVGIVEYLLVDVKRAQVVGLGCKTSGLMGRRQSLSWSQLVKIGRDSLVVHTEAAPVLVAASESQLAAAQNMTGLEVWTDGGDHIGRVVDLRLDRATGEVQQYLFALNQVVQHPVIQPNAALVTLPEANASASNPSDADGSVSSSAEVAVSVYAIAPQSIISAGRKRLMIAEEDAQRSHPYGPPLILKTAASNTPSWRPEQLPEIPTDFGELIQKGQSFAGKVSEQVRQRAKQFTDEKLANQDFVEADSLPDITEQLQAKTAHVKQQMQAQFNRAKEKARETAQDQMDGGLADRLSSTPLGRSLGKRLDKFKRPPAEPQSDPIDVASFEVWEDD
jgi:uncharacterized protein YrrD/Sec-independent protein translocase protein TatA